MKNTHTILSSLLCASSVASASLIYVASYSGTVSTLNYTQSTTKSAQLLNPISVSKQCSDNPSWLTLDFPNAVVYCINEGLNTPNGGLTSLKTNSDGSLSKLSQVSTANGPVSGVIFGKKRNGLALAHYGGSAFTTWDISNPSSLKLLEQKKYKLTGPPTDPDRQDAPHPHEAVLDPSGNFLLIPDLGADLIRTYTFDQNTLALKELPAVSVKGGYGPRHLAFVVKGQKTFAYLVTEMGNTIVGYQVTYPSGSIKFTQIFDIPSHGKGTQVPSSAAASEVVVSPDGNFLIVSSRAENTLTIPNFNPNNSSKIVSDPLINFSIDASTGALTAIQTSPAGGKFPRQFSINKAGTLLAVGLQSDARVVLIARDVKTGKLGNFVGYANIAGEITAAIFDE
ncbi:putative 6-phosphogluconolactonase -like protein [Cladobotryum mycophilum]|uniref:6-phosphogluconolactonase -like protein n=1 Tax=Cladobotryum mycophilum TaxID=491253 RepID=A0ABR0T2E9_9HYPO